MLVGMRWAGWFPVGRGGSWNTCLIVHLMLGRYCDISVSLFPSWVRSLIGPSRWLGVIDLFSCTSLGSLLPISLRSRMTSLASLWSDAMASSELAQDGSLSVLKFCEALKNLVATDPEVLGGIGGLPFGRRTALSALGLGGAERRLTMGDLLVIPWKPLQRFVEECLRPSSSRCSSMTPLQERCLTLLLAEMVGTKTISPADTMPLEEWLAQVGNLF